MQIKFRSRLNRFRRTDKNLTLKHLTMVYISCRQNSRNRQSSKKSKYFPVQALNYEILRKEKKIIKLRNIYERKE